MYRDHLKYLACPSCSGELTIGSKVISDAEFLEDGSLDCVSCGKSFPIVRGVPRFVDTSNYADSFGWEWTTHARTQYDSYTRTTISQDRFFDETRWPRELNGETILEVGCGAGRFTEQAVSTGAMVVSLDYSVAVDANYASHGRLKNSLIVQGDLYAMPLKPERFDRVLCIGVLQHTPAVGRAFAGLPRFLKPGGKLVVDVYAINWKTFFKSYYLLRPITKRIPHEELYAAIRRYVNLMWPLVRLIGKLPSGRLINKSLFVISDYRGRLALSDDLLKEWAILDTFDGLSPQFDRPQFLSTVKRWFAEAGFTDVEVFPGYNGIVGRGTKPVD
ncbi:MAG: methyltransferase domain-containing protein [Desulfomonile tiedjei]|nr:methyltransferase domain-containing protein [Desulfomonile tiedjei]